jgi:hypothetical protein
MAAVSPVGAEIPKMPAHVPSPLEDSEAFESKCSAIAAASVVTMTYWPFHPMILLNAVPSLSDVNYCVEFIKQFFPNWF